jgi:DNA-directed RNA polymerase subunit RPC12/RpoP
VSILKIVDDYELHQISAHFSPGLSQEIKTYAEEVVFKGSRYIFTRRLGKHQYGYCTYCKKEFKTDGLKHNQEALCPECGSSCIIKGSGMGRGKMVDEGYFVYYEKSLIVPEAIVARGIYAVRDYTGDYQKVKTQYKVIAFYVFKMGQSIMLKRSAYYSSYTKGKIEAGQYEKAAKIYSLVCKDHLSYIHSDYSRESIADAVKGTPFQYSTWDNYNYQDMTPFFDLYAKYPCIEYLTKLGFGNLVAEKLGGRPTLGAVNWKGKDLFKVLRISKQEFNEIRQLTPPIDFYFLKVLHTSKKEKWDLSISEISKIVETIGSYHFDDLVKVTSYSSIKKALGYLDKQFTKDSKVTTNGRWRFYNFENALTDYRDYLNDCIDLELDLTYERVLFPKNLYKAHQKTIQQRKLKTDEIINKKILIRAQNLQKYCFEHQGLFIRPAASFQELINEGKALKHCVGTYAENYAKGNTAILFIRKISNPDQSFYTVELRGKHISQIRGLKNCSPDKAVDNFVAAFSKARVLEYMFNKFGIPA